MKSLTRLAAATALGSVLAGNAAAASMEALQGAWTPIGIECAATFKKVGDKVEFIDRGSSLDTGVIISGSRIEGPNSTCTAGKIHESKDHFSAHLSCSDSIMAGGMAVSFKIINDSQFERFDPEFPEMSVTYQKCSF
jgi:hypothetical protein